jgi:hypothetical protein
MTRLRMGCKNNSPVGWFTNESPVGWQGRCGWYTVYKRIFWANNKISFNRFVPFQKDIQLFTHPPLGPVYSEVDGGKWGW